MVSARCLWRNRSPVLDRYVSCRSLSAGDENSGDMVSSRSWPGFGVLVGALALGEATPYLVYGIGTSDWGYNVLSVLGLASVGGLVVLFFVGDGPYALPAARFDWQQVGRVFHNRGVRLANFGYFGHMWELYAMWTWIPFMIRASLSLRGSNAALAEVA